MIARGIEEKSWRDKRGIEPKFDYAHTGTLTDIETGDLIKAHDIDNPLAMESTVSFYADGHLMLFCKPHDEFGSAYMYLFSLEDCAR